MGATPTFGFPYPPGTGVPPDVPYWNQQLAEAVEETIQDRTKQLPAGGTFTPTSGRINPAPLAIDRVIDDLVLSNYVSAAVAFTINTGAVLEIGTLSPAPRGQYMGIISTRQGPCEVVISTSGVVTLRNWGAVNLVFAVGGHIALSGVRYRISGT